MNKDTFIGLAAVAIIASGTYALVSIKQIDVVRDISDMLDSSSSAQVINPFVTLLTVNPSYVPNAYTTVFSWQAAGANGANIYFDCPVGVTVKDENGSPVSCGAVVSTGPYASGVYAYTLYNVSGLSAQMTVRLVPRDETGAESSLGGKSVTLTIGAAAQPLTGLSASTITPKSGEDIKITWTGSYVEGVNLQFDCPNNVRFETADSSKTKLDCGAPALSSHLPAAGTYTFRAVNSSYSAVPFKVTVLPSQGSGFYDATKSLSLNLTVQGISAPLEPSITKFSSTKTTAYSEEPFDFSWAIVNAKGANLQFQCNPQLSLFSVVGTTTAPLKCNTLALQEALGASGSTTISVSNKDTSPQYLTAVLLTQKDDDTYTTFGSRTVIIKVLTTKAPVGVPESSSPSASPTPSSGVPTPAAEITHITFSKSMGLGSRGEEVTALQKFLAQDKSIYPEATVSGYFGSLTELAVKRFQVKRGISSQGSSGYGYVGPKTRAMLNSLNEP